ncbi:hypothetical protein DY000_02002872 [Brassica cretica]|uniref:Uncharacterized protein n=1 Tax=Brassica cretica TaxID=69181 RepID=A0ABQ7CJ03_BRACR|nr:hypothetical protein DY000_02002872 [Brassica cretica]
MSGCSFNHLLVNWDEFSWLAGPCSPRIPSEQMEKVRIWLAKRRIMAEISTRKSIIKLSRSFADMVNQWLLLCQVSYMIYLSRSIDDYFISEDEVLEADVRPPVVESQN